MGSADDPVASVPIRFELIEALDAFDIWIPSELPEMTLLETTTDALPDMWIPETRLGVAIKPSRVPMKLPEIVAGPFVEMPS